MEGGSGVRHRVSTRLTFAPLPPPQEEDGEELELLHKPAGEDRPVDPHQLQALRPILLLRSVGV